MKFKLSAAALVAAGVPALAADLPARTAPPPPAPPAASVLSRLPVLAKPTPGLWNGFYLGGAVAYDMAAGDPKVAGPSGLTLAGAESGASVKTVEGFGGGLYGGYNMQFGSYVAGVEADVTSLLDSSARGTARRFVSSDAGATGSFDLTTREKRIGEASLRLRAGYVVMRDILLYAAGGVAMTKIERDWSMGGSIVVPGANNSSTTYTLANASGGDDKYRFGWTLGAGLDYMVLPDWTVRAEYRYTSFGDAKGSVSSACSANCGTATSALRFTDTTHSVRLGLAYHFGGPNLAPLSVRY